MKKITKFMASCIVKDAALGPRQLRLLASNGTRDMAGDILVPGGCIPRGATVPLLIDHDASIGSLVGRVAVSVTPEGVGGVADFGDAGISAEIDEVCAKAKGGLITDVSVGFIPLSAEPMPGGGYRYTKWELVEISLVVVGCNPDAQVIGRSAASEEAWKVGASKSLPIDMGAEWDGPEAAERILDDAGFNGDDPDPVKARKGFLVYDAANPDLKGSYKLPFADVIGGELKAVKAGIDAAASRLPQTDIPDDVAKKARGVLDHYEAQMKDDEKAAAEVRRKALVTKAATGLKKKGLGHVAWLSWLLEDLGWLQDCVQYEADLEGDGSQLPALLGQIMMDMGEALIAMTTEEVAELIADLKEPFDPDADDGDDLTDEEVEYVKAGPSVLRRQFRLELVKAGRVLSASNEADLSQARELLDGVLQQVASTDSDDTKAADLRAAQIRDLELLTVAA